LSKALRKELDERNSQQIAVSKLLEM
jgi:hypothetical protein